MFYSKESFRNDRHYGLSFLVRSAERNILSELLLAFPEQLARKIQEHKFPSPKNEFNFFFVDQKGLFCLNSDKIFWAASLENSETQKP